MNSSDQPSPDHPQITQLYHIPQYVPTSPLNSSLPSPQTTPSFSSSTPLKPSRSSSPLSPIVSCSHVEPGDSCLDCLDHQKKTFLNSPHMDLNYLVPSPSTALSNQLTAMRIMSPSPPISQQSHPSECSTSSSESPRTALLYSPESSSYIPEAHPSECSTSSSESSYSPESSSYIPEAHPHQQASAILRRRHSSNSSAWSYTPELPLPSLIPDTKASITYRHRHQDGDLPSCPDNFGINLDDRQLILISTRNLNKLLKKKAFKNVEKRKLKQKRRILKNRGYAAKCRFKRDKQANNLAVEVEDLEKRANSVDAEFDKKQKLLREVQHNFKRVFEWAENNPEIDVNKHLATYRKLL